MCSLSLECIWGGGGDDIFDLSRFAMPAVPSTKDANGKAAVCPHAAKLVANGDCKLQMSFMPHPVDGDADLPLNTGTTVADRKWIRPDLPSRCTWRLGGSDLDSPHTHPQR